MAKPKMKILVSVAEYFVVIRVSVLLSVDIDLASISRCRFRC